MSDNAGFPTVKAELRHGKWAIVAPGGKNVTWVPRETEKAAHSMANLVNQTNLALYAAHSHFGVLEDMRERLAVVVENSPSPALAAILADLNEYSTVVRQSQGSPPEAEVRP